MKNTSRNNNRYQIETDLSNLIANRFAQDASNHSGYIPTIPSRFLSAFSSLDRTYSSDRKSYGCNEILDFNQHASSLASFNELELPDMPQTDIQDMRRSDKSGITRSYQAVGMILNKNNEPVGSCILLPNGRILISAHTLEGAGDIRAFKAMFGYYTASSKCTYYSMLGAQEYSRELDYAIIKLASTPENIRPMEFDTDISSDSTALLHYPLGKPLQSSVNRRDDSTLYALRFITYHDSDFCSSGGAYINHAGKCCAIHLGCEMEGNLFSFNLYRYALEISTIHECNSNSLLFSPDKTIYSEPLLELPFVKRSYEDEKNRNSQKKAELAKNQKSIEQAIERTAVRLDTYDVSQYQTYTVRDLAAHFPELGTSILDNADHTQTNKTTFTNPNTGWYVCYDKHGKYNTVIDNHGNHVALDGSVSRNGGDAKYHFRNVVAEPSAAVGRFR